MRIAILLALSVLISCTEKKTVALLSDGSDLKLNEAVASTLAKHKADTFRLHLQSNTLAYGSANQISVDVMVSVLDPDKKQIAFYDGPARGAENFQFRTKAPGIYKIVVAPFQENEGKYSVTLTFADILAGDPGKQIEQIVNATMRVTDGVTPGVSVAVARDGKVVYSNGFGYADIEQEAKVTPQTIFHIASVSKQFTAFAIAMLANQGKLSVNDDIRKYLPELHDFGTPITINHLIHHTSGLRDQWNLLAIAGWRLDDVITQKQIMRVISRQRDLNFKPGDEEMYCNTGYTLMAEIVERVSGKSFPQWAQENIFVPLGMKNTLVYNDHEKIVKGRAYSYNQAADGFRKSVLSYANDGATSLFTTPEDLCQWAMNFENIKVGNPKVMDMMNQRFVLNRGDTINYAFGQVMEKYKGLRAISHGGGDAGYRTFLLRFPEQHFSVVVFSNLGSFNPAGLCYQIADIYLADQLKEEKPKDEQANTPSPQEPPFDASKIKLSDFVGKFYSPELETAYTFAIENDTLRAHHQRHDDIKLVPYKKDSFMAGAWFLGEVTFIRNKTNQVVGMKAGSGRVRGVAFDKM
ncbi:MAG TPA: serine hydrolase domain-containing protein [Cyclobacteriaceae bacterium]|jgi:CubicO group peptidase (beta-lactamase class C family)|nr:serine hydrolase domain-containing protein [Cyclobacteriaceae bacterium]